MSITELNALSQQIERSSPADREEQTRILGRIRELRDAMDQDQAKDLAGCLDAAGLMTEYLTQMGGIGPDGILRIVLRLVNVVREAYEEEHPGHMMGAGGSGMRTLPASSKPSPKLPTWRPLAGPHDQDGTLRMVTDLVLGEVMVQLGAITHEHVAKALQVQRATGQRFGEALVELGLVTWDQVQHAIRVQEHVRRGASDIQAAG